MKYRWRHNPQDLHALEGLPQTPVLLWVYGDQLRAIFEHVVLATYACRYDWQTRKVTDIHGGVWYATRFASPQQSLLPLTAQDCLVIYHPPLPRGRMPSRVMNASMTPRKASGLSMR